MEHNAIGQQVLDDKYMCYSVSRVKDKNHLGKWKGDKRDSIADDAEK